MWHSGVKAKTVGLEQSEYHHHLIDVNCSHQDIAKRITHLEINSNH